MHKTSFYCSTPLVGLGLIVLRFRGHTHLDTQHSARLRWTRDRSGKWSSTQQQPSLMTDIHALGETRNRNPTKK